MKQGLLFAAVFCIVALNGGDLSARTKKVAKEANTPAAPPIDLSQLKFPVIKKILPNGKQENKRNMIILKSNPLFLVYYINLNLMI